MKRIIALLLIAVMCLSFVACGNNAEKENTDNNAETNNTQVDKNQAIIGEWNATSITATAFFYENGTGKLTGNDVPREYDFTWKYDNELSCYVIAASQTMNTKIQVDDTGEYIILLGRCKFYRQDNSK